MITLHLLHSFKFPQQLQLLQKDNHQLQLEHQELHFQPPLFKIPQLLQPLSQLYKVPIHQLQEVLLLQLNNNKHQLFQNQTLPIPNMQPSTTQSTQLLTQQVQVMLFQQILQIHQIQQNHQAIPQLHTHNPTQLFIKDLHQSQQLVHWFQLSPQELLLMVPIPQLLLHKIQALVTLLHLLLLQFHNLKVVDLTTREVRKPLF